MKQKRERDKGGERWKPVLACPCSRCCTAALWCLPSSTPHFQPAVPAYPAPTPAAGPLYALLCIPDLVPVPVLLLAVVPAPVPASVPAPFCCALSCLCACSRPCPCGFLAQAPALSLAVFLASNAGGKAGQLQLAAVAMQTKNSNPRQTDEVVREREWEEGPVEKKKKGRGLPCRGSNDTMGACLSLPYT